MSDLAVHLDADLTLRRALGFKLRGYDTVLHDFATWLNRRGTDVITADRALTWAQSRSTSSPQRQQQRLTIVRRFADRHHLRMSHGDPRELVALVPPGALVLGEDDSAMPPGTE